MTTNKKLWIACGILLLLLVSDTANNSDDPPGKTCPTVDTSSTGEPVLICQNTTVEAGHDKNVTLMCWTKRSFTTLDLEWLRVIPGSYEGVIWYSWRDGNFHWEEEYKHKVRPLPDPLSENFSLEVSTELAQKEERYFCSATIDGCRYTCAVDIIVRPHEENTNSNGTNPAEKSDQSQDVSIGAGVGGVGGSILVILMILFVVFLI